MSLPTVARRLMQHQKRARKNGQMIGITSTLISRDRPRSLSDRLRLRVLLVLTRTTVLTFLRAWMPILPPDGLDRLISLDIAGLPIRSVYNQRHRYPAIVPRARNLGKQEATGNTISRFEAKYRHRHRIPETHQLRP
jgi:hypothetical protein